MIPTYRRIASPNEDATRGNVRISVGRTLKFASGTAIDAATRPSARTPAECISSRF